MRAARACVVLAGLVGCEESAPTTDRSATPVPTVGTTTTMMTAPTTMATAPMTTAPAAGTGVMNPMTTAPAAGTGAMNPMTTAPAAGTGAGMMTMGTAGTAAMATAGTAGTSGTQAGPDATCIAGFATSGSTAPMECQNCLCQPDHCVAELQALEGDTLAIAVVECAREAGCSGTCCLCGANCDDDPIGTYGTGPCAAEIEMAAGVTPGGGVLLNGTAVQMACMDASGSCGKAGALGECSATNCSTECGTNVCM